MLTNATDARLVYIALALSMAGNGLLAWSTHSWAARYEDLRDEDDLDPAARLPEIVGTDRKGERLRTGYDNDARRTLLVVFTPTCPYCVQNWPHWDRLVSLANPKHTRVVAIDLSGAANDEYLRQHNLLNVPLYTSVEYLTGLRYKLKSVPTTMLIRPDGVLEHVWKGVLSADAVATLEVALQSEPAATLFVTLPRQYVSGENTPAKRTGDK